MWGREVVPREMHAGGGGGGGYSHFSSVPIVSTLKILWKDTPEMKTPPFN